MTDDLLSRIQSRIARRSLLDHPFYRAWSAGELSIGDLRVYAAQYYHFEAEFPTLLSAIHSRCGDRAVRQSILDNLWDEEHGEANHRSLWLDFCEEIGLGRDEPEATEPLPATRAMLESYRSACRDRTFQEGLAAVYAWTRTTRTASATASSATPARTLSRPSRRRCRRPSTGGGGSSTGSWMQPAPPPGAAPRAERAFVPAAPGRYPGSRNGRCRLAPARWSASTSTRRR